MGTEISSLLPPTILRTFDNVRYVPPIISPSPSRMASISSGDARPSRRPMRFTESVRIWLILTQDRLGSLAAVNSSVSGNRARGSWLVSARAMTVPDRSLNTS